MDENNNVVVRVGDQEFVRGEDGYSPVVTVEEIEHGHSVTITDRDHPEGQSFDVLDGASAYEQAVAGGYEGTEAQFNAELAAFKDLSEQAASAATAAASAASAASESATAAADSATDAAGSASNAASASDRALRYASSASSSSSSAFSSAGRASNFASSAYHSAQTAEEQATAAAASATAAGNAQTAAEAAQTAAVAAKTATETARDTAISTLQTEGAAQKTAIQQKGAEVIASIPSDYTDLTEDVDDLKSALKVETTLTGWEKGSFNTTNGANYSDNTRICNQTLVGVSTGVQGFTLADGYTTIMFAWDLNGNYVGAYKTNGTWTKAASGWAVVTSFDFNTVPDYVIKLSVARDPVSADITADEGSNVIFHRYTDDTLTMAGKAADAKTIGDELFNYVQDKGIYGGTDANYINENCWMYCEGSSVVNCPDNTRAFWILTLRISGKFYPSNTRMQLAFNWTSGELSYRRANYQGVFTEWKPLGFDGRLGARYVAFGDSVTLGAVWTDGDIYTAQKKYQIPTRIASAINMTGNYTNEAVGGIGYVVKVNDENITDKILSYDFTNVEVITIQAGVNDKRTIPLGTINSTANDGSICGAIKAICNYMAENYPATQIIIIQPTPSGHLSDAWNGTLGGGWSLNDFISVVGNLCEQEHIAFVNLKESVYCKQWDSFSGGTGHGTNHNYSHFKTEIDYAKFGDFVAGKVSAFFHGNN